MHDPILVVYGSKFGATEGIAGKIGQVLRDAGLSADVLPAGRAGDVDRYGAIILGSGIYAGRWQKDAAKFLKRNEATLAAKPVWIFSSGPTGPGDPMELLHGWHIPLNLRSAVERIAPRGVTVFGGSLDTSKLNVLERWIIRKVKAPVGDFRDWQAVSKWAQEIAAVLKESRGAER